MRQWPARRVEDWESQRVGACESRDTWLGRALSDPRDHSRSDPQRDAHSGPSARACYGPRHDGMHCHAAVGRTAQRYATICRYKSQLATYRGPCVGRHQTAATGTTATTGPATPARVPSQALQCVGQVHDNTTGAAMCSTSRACTTVVRRVVQ